MVDVFTAFGKALFCAIPGGFGPSGINIRRDFGGFGQNSQHLIVHIGKTAGNEHIGRGTVLRIPQAAGLEGGQERDVMRQHAELAHHTGADSHIHLSADHGLVGRDHFQLQRAHGRSLFFVLHALLVLGNSLIDAAGSEIASTALTANGVAGETHTFAAADIQAAAEGILPEGYELTGEASEVEVAYGDSETVELQAEEAAVEEPDNSETEDEGGFSGIEDEYHDFYIDENKKVTVVFQKYEIAPGYMGIQSFEISNNIEI